MRLGWALVALVAVLSLPTDARAHPLGFAVLTIDEIAHAHYFVVLRVSGSETDPGNLAITWPDDCSDTPVETTTADEVREHRWELTCREPLAQRSITVEGPRRGIELLALVRFAGRPELRVARQALPATFTLGEGASTSLFAAHFVLGLEHFALGIDHVLFVIGAFFLARRLGMRALVLVISAFTVGHALTLALATLGLLVLAPRPVEACIALSLVHVARELRLTEDTITRTRPALVAGLFGLVHGAGFARALGDAGLGGADLVVGLVSFNLGLEVAQLALVLVCLALFFRESVAKRAEPFAALLVGGVGAYFVLDRTLALLAARGS